MKSLNELETRNELADYLKIPKKTLSYILYIKKVDELYISFEIPKKGGGVRSIDAPVEQLKNIQRKVADALWKYQLDIWKSRNVNPNISHAFTQGKGIITNAQIHRNKRFVYNLDLENFFDSFHFGRVRGFFLKNRDYQFADEVAATIANLCCYKGKLPQGAPSSPIITNLICNVMDMRLLKIAKKYKLDYTRYADDLTFSTNDRKFLEIQEQFYQEVAKEIESSGFKINDKKTRLQFRDSRQEVTGVIVNKKLNVNRDYYKRTRAMAYELYTKGEFFIDGEAGTMNQLEGRFSFIDQLEQYNNKRDGNKHNFNELNGRERQYQKFLFYKYFFVNEKPVIVTEGKTDIVYIKAALKNLYKEYPALVTKHSKGEFGYKISFFKKTKRRRYFLNIVKDGGDIMKNIYNFFTNHGGVKLPNYLESFKKLSETIPQNPVILLLDNEFEGGKPVGKFVKYLQLTEEEKETLKRENRLNIVDNLYLVVTPLTKEKESDIEDLFDKETLAKEINGKSFCKKDKYDINKYYGKEIFSKHIMRNYEDINFDGFKPLLNNIQSVVESYQSYRKGK